jgi:hypothetical protein
MIYDILENKHRHFYTAFPEPAKTPEIPETAEIANIPRFPNIPEFPSKRLLAFKTAVYPVGEFPEDFPNEIDGIVARANESLNTESEPEWCEDSTSTWNFPETEPFEEPGVVYASDILSKLSLKMPEPYVETPPKTPESPDLVGDFFIQGEPDRCRRKYNSSSFMRYERGLYADEPDVIDTVISPLNELRLPQPTKPPGFWDTLFKKTFKPEPENDIDAPKLERYLTPSPFENMSKEEEAEEEKRRRDDNIYFSRFGIPPINYGLNAPGIPEIRVCDLCDNLATEFGDRELCKDCYDLDILIVDEDEEPPYKKQRIA